MYAPRISWALLFKEGFKVDVKTLKEARYRIADLERQMKGLTSYLAYMRKERELAEEARNDVLDKLEAVSERADDIELLDALFQALADYKTFGWTDRLDTAIALVS